MQRFLDSVFPFLVVVAFVGLRIVSMVRRRRRDGQRSAPPAPPQAARGFVPWENEFRDSASAGDAVESAPAPTAANDEEDFSAWSLSVDDEPPPPPAPPPRVPETPRPGPAAPVVPLAAAPLTPESVAPPLRRAEPGRRAEQRFRELSPVQQGVVWAEILGAPKGLD